MTDPFFAKTIKSWNVKSTISTPNNYFSSILSSSNISVSTFSPYRNANPLITHIHHKSSLLRMIERISLFLFVWIKCNSNLCVGTMMTTCHHICIEYGKYEGPDNVKSYILMCTFLSLLKATSKGVLKVKSLTIHFIFTIKKEKGNERRRNKLIHLLWLFAVAFEMGVKASLFVFFNRNFLSKRNFVGKFYLSRTTYRR